MMEIRDGKFIRNEWAPVFVWRAGIIPIFSRINQMLKEKSGESKEQKNEEQT